MDEIEEYGKIFCIAWYHAKTTPYEPLFTGNQHTMTDYLAKRLTILFHTKGLRYEPRREEQIVSDLDDSLADEIKHLNIVLIKNNYSTDFIERNTHTGPNDSSNNSYTTTAHFTLHDTRDLRNHTTHTTTLQHSSCTQTHVHCTVSTNVKGKDEPEDRPRLSL